MTGWNKDPRDEKDYLHPTVGVELLPDKVDLGHLLPEVRQQGSMNSCVGHGIGSNITGITKDVGCYREWQSPQWIWNMARKAQGWLGQNVGVYPRDALDALVKNGCLLESSWPYNADQLDTTDPDQKASKAIKYPQFTYYRCVDGVDGICSALAAGHLVSIGCPWFAKWFSLSPIGTLSAVTKDDPTVGGHATLIYGYDKSIGPGVFLGMNSWGTEWGENGFYKVYFSAIPVFKQLWGYDAHYITFESLVEEKKMISFSGKVSAQAQSNEPVVIQVSTPDGGATVINCLTDADGKFFAQYQTAPGIYSAQAFISGDSHYNPAQSDKRTFTVSLEDRTISLDVA